MAVEIGEELIFENNEIEQTYEVLFICEANGHHYLFAGVKEELEKNDEDQEIDIISFRYTEQEDGSIAFDEIENEDEWKSVETQFELYLEQSANDTYSG